MVHRQDEYISLSSGHSSDTKNFSSLSPRLKSMWNVTCGILMILAVSIVFLLYIENDYYIKSNQCGKKSKCYLVDDYVVFTEGCHIFDFAPFEYVHLPFFTSESDVEQPSCDPKNKGELVKSTATHLYVDTIYAKNYTSHENDLIECCYQPFDRMTTPRTENNKYEDFIEGDIRFSKHCHNFKDPVVIKHQFVYVKCMNASNDRIYEDYFTFAVEDSEISSVNTPTELHSGPQEGDDLIKRIAAPKSGKEFSVLILGFDSMSRLNFLRQMPATASFFEENGGISLLGYNKVGYNTFPNLIPVLTGMNVSQLRKTCWPSRATALDDCPFIWKLFHHQDYFTAYAEDNTFTSTFTYRKAGFRQKPVDYYVKPYYVMCESQLKVVSLNPPTSIHCLGLRKNLDRFVEIIQGFATNMKDRKSFGLFWFNGMSHDFLNVGRDSDKMFRSMLDSLKKEGALNHTVVVALSDHGMRWGKFRETFQGFSEERLPLATIFLPESFQVNFPQAHHNLRTNAKRLTVPFDLHETLLDILSVTRLPDLNFEETPNYTALPRGISLFQPIPDERTCKDAGVPPEFCACSDLRLVDDKKLHLLLGLEAVASVNELLRNVSEVCAFQGLVGVDSVFEQTSAMGSNKPFSFRNREFFVRFRTTPGNGSFEALMQISGKKDDQVVEPLGVISRISMYHNDSYCVDDEILKLYCYCFDNDKHVVSKSDDNVNLETIINLVTDPVPNTKTFPSEILREKNSASPDS